MAKVRRIERSGDYPMSETISMLLKVPREKHEWLKEVAEKSEKALTQVVQLLIDQAAHTPPESYIETLTEADRLKRIEDLKQQMSRTRAELEELQEKQHA